MPFHFTIYICVHIQSDLARSLTFQLINPSVEVFVPYIWKSLPSPHIGERSQRSYRVGVNHIYGDVTVIPIIITIVHTTAILNGTSLVQSAIYTHIYFSDRKTILLKLYVIREYLTEKRHIAV